MTTKTFAELKAADDARFGPMLSAMDDITARFDLLAGENIYILTLLLVGSIHDAPEDVRELFRGAVVQTLLRERGSGSVLRDLCLDGWIAPSAARPYCEWSQVEEDYSSYETGCGECFEFNDGTPAENKAKFCLYCGAAIKQRLAGD